MNLSDPLVTSAPRAPAADASQSNLTIDPSALSIDPSALSIDI
jgi:hypothetical protein